MLPINFVVALPAEAKPIARHFGLKRQQPDGKYPVYQNKQIKLVVSGVGKAASASATAFLQADSGCTQDAIWLNLGIAGHSTRPVGEPILARRIIDNHTGQHWESRQSFDPPCELEDLLTLEHPLLDYKGTCAFDMEAAGFFFTASRFSKPGLVQCFKIISDNQENPACNINACLVSRLLEDRIDILSVLIARLKNAALEPAQNTKTQGL